MHVYKFCSPTDLNLSSKMPNARRRETNFFVSVPNLLHSHDPTLCKECQYSCESTGGEEGWEIDWCCGAAGFGTTAGAGWSCAASSQWRIIGNMTLDVSSGYLFASQGGDAAAVKIFGGSIDDQCTGDIGDWWKRYTRNPRQYIVPIFRVSWEELTS